MILFRSKILKSLSILLLLLLFCPDLRAEGFSSTDLERLLSSSLEELMDYKIVSASKIYTKLSDTPASAIIITKEDITKYGYRSLEEILANVPGFYTNDNWEAEGENFGVRGFWSNTWNRNVAFLVNGVRQIDDFNSSNLMTLMNVPVEAIDKIEIIRGPMSVMYGSGAFFGVINIITNEVDPEEKQILSSVSYGSNNTYSVFGRAQGIEDKFQYVINTSYMHTDGLDVDFSNLNPDLPTGSTKNRMKDTRKHFSFSGIFDNINAEFSYVETFSTKGYLFPPINEYDGDVFLAASRIGLTYNKDVNEKFTYNAKLLYNHCEVEYDYDTGLTENAWEVQDLKSSSVRYELDAFYKISPVFKTTLGLEYSSAFDIYTTYDLPLFNLSNVKEGIDDDKIVTRALFLQADYSFSDKLMFIGGFRLEQMMSYNMEKIMFQGLEHSDPDNHYNYEVVKGSRKYNQDDVEIIPRFAAIYSLNSKNVLKLLYGEAMNHPSYLVNRDIVLSPQSPDIDSERLRTLEVNFMSSPRRNLTVNLSAFSSYFDNLITRSSGFYSDGTYYSNWDNSGRMTARGAEIQILYNPFRKFETDLSFTTQKVDDEKADRAVSFAPEMLAYLKLHYAASQKLSIATTGYYVSSMESQWDPNAVDQTDPSSPIVGRIGEKVDGYFNLSFDFRVKNMFIDNTFLNLHFYNILDSDIIYATTTSQPWAVKGTTGRGSSIYATIGYNFD